MNKKILNLSLVVLVCSIGLFTFLFNADNKFDGNNMKNELASNLSSAELEDNARDETKDAENESISPEDKTMSVVVEPGTESSTNNLRDEYLAQKKEEVANSLFKVNQLDYDDEWCHSMELNATGSVEAVEKLRSWHETRGHFSSGEFNNYVNYDEATLKKIGKQGDLRALYTLVNNRDIDEDTKLWASETAAIWGDTSATAGHYSLEQLAVATYGLESDDASARDAAKGAIFEALAWAEFTALRGDFTLLDSAILFVGELESFKLSELEKQRISLKAKQIYNDLNEERANLGLPPFDDSIPKPVKSFNDLLVAEYKEKGWDKWGTQFLTESECVNRNLQWITQVKPLQDY